MFQPSKLPNRLTGSVSRRSILVGGAHALAFAIAYFCAYALRFGLPVPGPWMRFYWVSLPVFVGVKLAVFYLMGHWRFSWRHPTFSALSALLRSSLLSTLLLATLYLMFFKISPYPLPRSILGLDCAMTILTLGGFRTLWRLSREEFRSLLSSKNCRRALIVGANPSGEFLARQFLDGQHYGLLAVGFLDDDPKQRGSRLAGVRVLGSIDRLGRIAESTAATDVLVISGTVTGQRLRKLMTHCRQASLNLKVIPAMDDLLSDNYSLQMRDLDINDLLRREPVQLSDDLVENLIAGRSIMVTGAGGSIGAEICRQVCRFGPRKLLLVERSENSLFEIDAELRAAGVDGELLPALADINDRARLEQIFAEHRPAVVFHAAAHKHVPMMEHNPGEAIKNNVLGTVALAELADDYAVEQFVLISTDKSVRPVSVMGASKRLAEQFVQAFSQIATTRFSVVRFGNVLGSAGSVVPIFQAQIRRGGPITVTHPEMQRFFMTIPEAAQLVLQSACLGKGGEIFVLDMGEPVRIVDLARDLIRLSRLTEDDIEIRYTGMRPGEKLHENLYCENEQVERTAHPKIHVAVQAPAPLDALRATIARLRRIAEESPEKLLEMLREVLPDFRGEAVSLLAEGQAPGTKSPRPERSCENGSTGQVPGKFKGDALIRESIDGTSAPLDSFSPLEGDR